MSRRFFQLIRNIRFTSFRAVASTCLLGGTGLALLTHDQSRKFDNFLSKFPMMDVQCATALKPQDSVISDIKQHALYLSIQIAHSANPQDCLKALSKMQYFVDQICPPDLRDESDEILCGVGFGPTFFDKIKDSKCRNVPFAHKARFGPNGDIPSTGGDIFIHAKCNEQGKLYELADAIVHEFPKGSISNFSDIYGWVYRGGRDLTGFVDGTENPPDDESRMQFAVDSATGGSYLVNQKWIHKHDVIRSTKDSVKEGFVGRQISDSTELKNKAITSHVARMVGNTDFGGAKKHQVVRQSQPYGTVSGESGLIFMAYARSPEGLDWMLDRMTGYGDDKKSDDIMRMTSCVASTFYYFPSQDEMDRLYKNAGGERKWW